MQTLMALHELPKITRWRPVSNDERSYPRYLLGDARSSQSR